MSVFDCYTSWKLFQSDELGVDFGFTYCIAAPLHTKYCLKINGCNQLLIDFLLSLSRCSVCEVQSPAMHRRQQTVPLPWTRRHQLTRRTGWIRFHTGLHSNRLLSSIKLSQSSASFHAKVAVYVIFWFSSFFFSLSFVFILLSCAPNSSFSIKTHVIAFSNTPVPHWSDVCFDYVLSRSCQGTLSLWVSTQTYSMPEKGTVNRQVGVLIIIHSDFDSN